MKQLKMLGLAAVAAAALTALLAPGAAATTLEVGGVTQNESVGISMSLEPETSIVLRDTVGFTLNRCNQSTMGGSSGTYTGSTVTSELSSLTFAECTFAVMVHKAGTLHFSHTGTTNATVTSSGAEVTTGSVFGTLTCKTGAGTHLGTLTGSATGHATIHVNASINCSGISSKLAAIYTVTSPTGLGVSA